MCVPSMRQVPQECGQEKWSTEDNILYFVRLIIVEHSDNGSGGAEKEATTDFVSRFHIAPILDQDTGEISCEVANRFGRDSKTFLLSIEGM